MDLGLNGLDILVCFLLLQYHIIIVQGKLKTVVFYFHTITSDFNQFVSCGLAEREWLE